MRRLRDERGATAVLLALLMMVFVGFAALVVDVGGMHSEVRQLQNVADAAAVAIAQDCAAGACGATDATAQFYAAGNSRDLLSNTTVAIPGDGGGNSVTVTATTRDVTGGNDGADTTLRWTLAQALSQDEATFQRKATAKWGIFGGGATIPIALCERSWDYFTTDGTVLPSGPPGHIVTFGAPNPNAATVEHQDCSNPSYDTYAGGFGILDRDENCMAITEDGEWYQGKPGDNPVDADSECDKTELYAMLRYLIDSGEPAMIPIFDGYRGTGTNGEFHVIGYGALILEGFSFQGGGQGSTYQMTNTECKSNTSCLKLYFTDFIEIGGAASLSSGDLDFGAYYVGLTE